MAMVVKAGLWVWDHGGGPLSDAWLRGRTGTAVVVPMMAYASAFSRVRPWWILVKVVGVVVTDSVAARVGGGAPDCSSLRWSSMQELYCLQF
jgi:hypothetical protein